MTRREISLATLHYLNHNKVTEAQNTIHVKFGDATKLTESFYKTTYSLSLAVTEDTTIKLLI